MEQVEEDEAGRAPLAEPSVAQRKYERHMGMTAPAHINDQDFMAHGILEFNDIEIPLERITDLDPEMLSTSKLLKDPKFHCVIRPSAKRPEHYSAYCITLDRQTTAQQLAKYLAKIYMWPCTAYVSMAWSTTSATLMRQHRLASACSPRARRAHASSPDESPTSHHCQTRKLSRDKASNHSPGPLHDGPAP
eukprot:168284-Amphidinium_carterae.2